jgi:Protein of unknown function (DUF2786)
MNDKIVERIKKLLALADDQAGLPEGDRAAFLASKLMRENAIELSSLNIKEEILKQDFEVGRSNWKRNLMNLVANFCSCKYVFLLGKREGFLIGYKSDAEIASYLFDLIVVQIEAECQAYLNTLFAARGKKAANDFKTSAVYGVAEKFRQIKSQDGVSDSSGTALVLARSKQVDAWVRENMNVVSAASKAVTLNSQGYNAGKNVRLSAGIPNSRLLEG